MNAAIPERKPATEQISGVIERVTFHNDDSGFCVHGSPAVHWRFTLLKSEPQSMLRALLAVAQGNLVDPTVSPDGKFVVY